MEAARGCEDNDARGSTSVQFKLEISNRRTVDGGTALALPAFIKRCLDFHAMSSLTCSDGDLDATPRAVLDDDGG